MMKEGRKVQYYILGLYCVLVMFLFPALSRADGMAKEIWEIEESDEAVADLGASLQSETELNYESESGNTDARTLKGRLSLQLIQGPQRYRVELTGYQLMKDKEEDKNEIKYLIETAYLLRSQTYLYGRYNSLKSKYGAYLEDFTLAGGLGYTIWKFKESYLRTELGLGYRYEEPNLDEIDEDSTIFPDVVSEPIVQMNLDAAYSPTTNVVFHHDVIITAGESNTRFETKLSIEYKLTQILSVDLDYHREYLTRVPDGKKKTDSQLMFGILLHH